MPNRTKTAHQFFYKCWLHRPGSIIFWRVFNSRYFEEASLFEIILVFLKNKFPQVNFSNIFHQLATGTKISALEIISYKVVTEVRCTEQIMWATSKLFRSVGHKLLKIISSIHFVNAAYYCYKCSIEKNSMGRLIHHKYKEKFVILQAIRII